MTKPEDDSSHPSRRTAMASGAALLGSTILASGIANAQTPAPAPAPAADAMPQGYNILFVLVDQEHFFPTWPFPVPAREAIKKKAITFLNHQAASCVCSSARSVVYTGQHIQQTGIADNLNYIWQRDLSPGIKTVGHRLAELGYHAAYQGKWHLSANLDLNDAGRCAAVTTARPCSPRFQILRHQRPSTAPSAAILRRRTLATAIVAAHESRRCARRSSPGTSPSISSTARHDVFRPTSE